MKKVLFAIVSCAFLFLPLSVGAEGTVRKSDLGDRQGSAPQVLGGQIEVIATSRFYALNGANDPLAFPDGSQAVVTCSSQSWVCWTMMFPEDVTLNTTTASITDSASGAGVGQDGRSACRRVEAGSGASMVADLSVFSNTAAVGRRVNTCTAPSVGRPCFDDRDCVGASTCNTSSTFSDIKFVYLMASTADCAWVNEGVNQ